MDAPIKLRHYLEQVLGEVPGLRRVDTTDLGLPLFLARGYELWRGRLFDHPVLFAIARQDDADASLKRLVADQRKIEQLADSDHVVLVLPHASPHKRRRLIRQGLPFVVPGRQMFIPTMLVDLREHFPRPRSRERQRFGWAAQVVLLRHILWKDVEGLSLQSVAQTVGYSKMTMSNVRDELVTTKVCEEEIRGSTKRLRFPPSTRTTWETALPFLRSPVRRILPIWQGSVPRDALKTGITALASQTMLGDDPIPTVAMDQARFRISLESGQFATCPAEDEAAAFVQVWHYDPGRLARSDSVDALSLYLSLRDEHDDRIQQSVETLLERVPW